MQRYRFYCLGADGRIALADWIDAPDDAAAIESVRQLKHGARRCEIWEHQRLVAALEAGDLR
jgi:hypothetical protein